VTLEGDPEVELYPAWGNQLQWAGNPPSGRFIVRADAGLDPVAGTQAYDVTVKLRIVADPNEQETALDPYLSGDKRGDAFPPVGDSFLRWDSVLGNGGLIPRRAAFQQTVTINPNRSKVMGRSRIKLLACRWVSIFTLGASSRRMG
jgi:hypothetical protein